MIDPIAFTIAGKAIYWYGILVALGFLAAVWHWNRQAQAQQMPEGIGSDLGLVVILAGILGARLAYVLANLGHYIENPAEILRIDQGGLIFYGGFILAAVTVLAMARMRRLPVWGLADFTVSALPLGHAFGRLGCLLNGCCYGSATDWPWAVWTAGARRHPVQLYETLFNLLLYVVLLRLLRSRRPGLVSAVYLLGYGGWRFLVEFWRGDDRLRVTGLDAAQAVSLVLMVVGAGLAMVVMRRPAARAG